MIAAACPPNPIPKLESLQAAFLSILPRIERHARISFRHIKCPHRKEDCIAETVGRCWKWFVGLAQRGKDARRFPTVLAVFAARQVKNGRRLCGKEKSKDVMSTVAQSRHSFVVQSLPQCDTSEGKNEALDALRDNTRTPPPEQAAFRLDFPAWLGTLTDRNRRLAQDMALGHRTRDLADSYGTTPGRISQVRRELKVGWDRFCGDENDLDRDSAA